MLLIVIAASIALASCKVVRVCLPNRWRAGAEVSIGTYETPVSATWHASAAALHLGLPASTALAESCSMPVGMALSLSLLLARSLSQLDLLSSEPR